MDNPLIREAVVSACSMIAQASAAANNRFERLASQQQVQDQEMKIYDAREKQTVVAFIDARSANIIRRLVE